jgi:hypothetical protein
MAFSDSGAGRGACADTGAGVGAADGMGAAGAEGAGCTCGARSALPPKTKLTESRTAVTPLFQAARAGASDWLATDSPDPDEPARYT